MRIVFDKYHGTGNDFIMVDIRNHAIPDEPDIIAYLCHRRFGVGADGLIFLDNSAAHDFSMRYFNSDGREASMCGNGGRCITAFARKLGIIEKETVFEAADGLHRAGIISSDNGTSRVRLKMIDVRGSEWSGDEIYLDTGSPHLVKYCQGVKELNVQEEGSTIRRQKRFGPEGTNVNFIEESSSGLYIRTYERGVEDETYSCGTGATAAALAWAIRNRSFSPVKLESPGGELLVHFKQQGTDFTNIYLEGPATYVFSGEIEI
ncbi:MAG: diaminopimelate epimerase [Bacteroidales bacterium]|jgi:diaminopimelate epimerase|nr:diaminopimelate epimerase [Bacteroidales bacterium]